MHPLLYKQAKMAVSGFERASPWFPMLVVSILGALVIAALSLGQAILIPLALGIVLSFLLQPLVRLLERGGLSRVPAVLTVVALVAFVLAGVGWSVGG